MEQTQGSRIDVMEASVMVNRAVAESIRVLAADGAGVRAIARRLGLARNTVRRYLDVAVEPGVQRRPGRRALSPAHVERVKELWEHAAAGNACVIRDLLAAEGVEVSLRSIQRVVEPLRRQQAVDALVTPRFETEPGEQLQVDFGERNVPIGERLVRVHFFVATLGYSRRIFVRATLSQRQDEWMLGIEGALQRFGGCPAEVLVDNARALIVHHGTEGAEVHRAFEAFCKDRGVHVRACRPYRARTKGKVESGVKYVKRNAIAGRRFESFAALEAHLLSWMDRADRRVHGTTHRQPIELFEKAERAALRPLRPALEVTTQRIRRVVANDCFVDVDTVRYSVPHRFAGVTVDVRVTGGEVIIERAGVEVARHTRSCEAYARIARPEHFAGIFRSPEEVLAEAAPAVVTSVVAQWAQSRLAQWAALAAEPRAGGAP